MDDLNNKLHKLWEEDIEHPIEFGEGVSAKYYGLDRDEFFEKVHIAYKEAGYIQNPVTLQMHKSMKEMSAELLHNEFMTGQEWYDRFRAEIDADSPLVGTLSPASKHVFDEALKAAKKASGIS
jgi:bisphosphoglycerate-independent phosphoglycerate mutase (AlkP superfamily)